MKIILVPDSASRKSRCLKNRSMIFAVLVFAFVIPITGAIGAYRLDVDRDLPALDVGDHFTIRGLGGLAYPANGLLPESLETAPSQPTRSPPAIHRTGEGHTAIKLNK